MTNLTEQPETVEGERDEARQIVRDIYWMARRYADGRQSYAVGMFNDAVRKAYDAGWLEHRISDEPPFARDSMFSPEWRSIEQRALDAEAKLAASHPTPAGAAMPDDAVERATIERCARIATDYAIRMSGAAKRSVSKSAAETFEAHGCAGNNIAAAIQALATNAPEATDAAKPEGEA